MTDNLDILKDVRQMLDKPEAWIKYHFCAHRTLDGTIIDISIEHDKRANCFCLTGAIMIVIDKYSRKENPSLENCWKWIKAKKDFIRHITNYLGVLPDELGKWNDDQDRTHADILDLLDSLINEAEATT